MKFDDSDVRTSSKVRCDMLVGMLKGPVDFQEREDIPNMEKLCAVVP